MNKKRIYLLTIMILLLSLSFIGCTPNKKPIPKRSSVITPTEFLKKNHQTVAINTRGSQAFSILNNDLKGKEVFFLGEIHGIQNNEKLDFELLKYLKNKVGIKYYLAEMGYSSAYFINRYLETGDERFLNQIFDDFQGTIGWTKEGYDYWKGLYAYNKTLPKNKKIKVVGIDIEHEYELGIMHMYSILPKKTIPSSIKPVISTLINMYNSQNFDPNTIKSFMLSLKGDMTKKPSIYKKYLGSKLFDFQQISNNILNDFEFTKIENDWYKSSNLRDKMIYDNFKKISSHLPKGKYYGLWGRPHAFEKQRDNINYVASLMNNTDPRLRKKVLSVVIYYKDCNRLSVTNTGYGKEAYSDDNSLTNPLNESVTENISIFRLTGKNSPFNKGLNLVETPTGGGRTVDYFQYIIFIKDAGPSLPLK